MSKSFWVADSITVLNKRILLVFIAAACTFLLRLSVFETTTLTVSLGMHKQGDKKNPAHDAQQTRKVTRVVYHKDYNDKTKVSLLLRLLYV
jgi:hypothetical protein